MSKRLKQPADNATAIATIVAIGVLTFLAQFLIGQLAKAQDFAPTPEPTPAAVEVVTPAGLEAAVADYEQQAAELSKRFDAAQALVEANNEHLRTILPTTTLQETVDELSAKLREGAVENPCAGLRSPADITERLQKSLDTAHQHRKPIVIPAGEWTLSKPIRTPFRSGLTLLGSGPGGMDNDMRLVGARTLLKTTADPAFELCGSDIHFGNFSLVGSGTETGIVITNPGKGLGVGTIRFAPIHGHKLGTIVQCAKTISETNCDNLHFEWLKANKCKCAYRGINTQGMDIVFERLNLDNTPVGIEMQGGGSLWVQYSTTCHPATLLKVPDTLGKGVGKYNGYFRLSNTKVDSQAKDGFTLIDCAEPYPIRFLADGGLYSHDDAKGTFAKLSGGNHLEIRDWTATFQVIEGVADKQYGTPTVMLRGSRLWKSVDDIFRGEVSARVRDCVSKGGKWFDWENGK